MDREVISTVKGVPVTALLYIVHVSARNDHPTLVAVPLPLRRELLVDLLNAWVGGIEGKAPQKSLLLFNFCAYVVP